MEGKEIVQHTEEMNKADKKIKDYYVKLQQTNTAKQGVRDGSQDSEKLRKRTKVDNS